MFTLTEILSNKVSGIFESCGYSAEFGTVKVSDRPDLCQFQCNGAFAAAKIYKKAPDVIAADVVSKLLNDNSFEKVSVVGKGFINIDIADRFLLNYLQNTLSDSNLGIKQAETKEIIFLDYGGPNAAKPLHVGHLRSAIIGDSLKRLVEATGRKTISDVHLGDWGLQMGLVIAELEDRDNCGDEISLTSEEWDTVYAIASQKSKLDEQFRKRAQEITVKFQNGDKKYISVWEKIMKISINSIKENYKVLGVDFDLWNGESDAAKYVPELIETLEKEKLLEESMGAKVVNVSLPEDSAPVPPVIIKKSNGSNIYATTDLATIIERNKLYHPDEMWYIVDSRQNLYFTQIFRCARKALLVPKDTVLLHLCFGTMNGKDGKPYKTRDGGVMKLSDLYKTVYDIVYKRVRTSLYSKESDKQEISHKLAVAAIKFGDLINHRTKDYVFDIDKFTASEGKTGIFLLYTISRINSILKKCGDNDDNLIDNVPNNIYSETERKLILRLSLTNEMYETAFLEKAPNLICENAYNIASAFSKFYSEIHIIDEKDCNKKNSWLYLCKATKIILQKHLDILGIESVEFM